MRVLVLSWFVAHTHAHSLILSLFTSAYYIYLLYTCRHTKEARAVDSAKGEPLALGVVPFFLS